MTDFSRAEGARNHRNSFSAAANGIIEFVEKLRTDYITKSNELEVYRKERSAIIEETIKLIKDAKIRLNKQLGRCNNAEINEELLNAINALKDDTKENIQINLIKINNRYDKIQELGKELEEISQSISKYRVAESDYDDEIIISIPKKNNKLNEKDANIAKNAPTNATKLATPKSETSGLEKVISIHSAGSHLLAEYEKIRKFPEKTNQTSEEESPLYFEQTDLYNTEDLLSLQDNTSEYTPKQMQGDEDECILFTITDKLTLKEIAKNVYQSEDNWISLYYYGNNTNKIDNKAMEYGLSIEEIVSNPGYLANTTLQFPTLLIKPEEEKIKYFPEKKTSRRIA